MPLHLAVVIPIYKSHRKAKQPPLLPIWLIQAQLGSGCEKDPPQNANLGEFHCWRIGHRELRMPQRGLPSTSQVKACKLPDPHSDNPLISRGCQIMIEG